MTSNLLRDGHLSFRPDGVYDIAKSRVWCISRRADHEQNPIGVNLHKLNWILDQGRPEKLLQWLKCLDSDRISHLSLGRTTARIQLQNRIHANHAWRQLGWFIWDGWRLGDDLEKKERGDTAAICTCPKGGGEEEGLEVEGEGDKVGKGDFAPLYGVWSRQQHSRNFNKIQREELDRTLGFLHNASGRRKGRKDAV